MTRESHLAGEQIQGLADGTLRGPEGLAVREHCDLCPACGAELDAFAALSARLSALRDPPVPEDFTAGVLAAAAAREAALAQRRQTLFAALPAAAVGLFAVVGWTLSIGFAARVSAIVEAWSFISHFLRATGPVVEAARLPLGVGAFGLAAVALALLVRALRPSEQAPAPADS